MEPQIRQARNRAESAAMRAAICIRYGQVAEARALLAEASRRVDELEEQRQESGASGT